MATNTSGTSGDRLYELLPAVYRQQDAEQGYPLRGLLALVTEQADLLDADIARLWDDLFIETCQPWVIPYIGELVGNRLLSDGGRAAMVDRAREVFRDLVGPDLLPPPVVRTRTDVAKTIYYRRRKGTLPMLEELARDVTGWPAHAVEFFELLGWHQHLEHYRPQSAWVDVRRVDRMERVEGAFDEATHTPDVRPISTVEGWHNLHNIGFFLYRLGSYELERVPARQGALDWQYHASPLGNPAPLFSRWRREGDEAGLATELHVPAPIRRAFFYEDLQRYKHTPPTRPTSTDLYGFDAERSLAITRNGVPVAPSQNPAAPLPLYEPEVVCRRLDPWPAVQPSGRVIAVDVAAGRLAVGDGWGDATASLDVSYHYGFPADLGGGPYERARWLIAPEIEAHRISVEEGVLAPPVFPDVVQALAHWAGPLARESTVITIRDSRSYALPGQITLLNEAFLAIEAANGERPLLRTPLAGLDIEVSPPVNPADPDRQGALTLNGVVVEGHLTVTGDLGFLRLIHATLVPGRRLNDDGTPAVLAPSLRVAAGPAGAPLNAQLEIQIAASILGAIEAPDHVQRLFAIDSILDALADNRFAVSAGLGRPGPPLDLERCTVFGRLHVRQLAMSESIATGRVVAVRTQEGCVRFSFVPASSHTPRRYRCQPDLAMAKALEEALARDPLLPAVIQAQIRAAEVARVVPGFTSRRYGLPAYAQLAISCPVEIRRGAEDGAEMGVYSHLKQPQREGNLRLRLDEYLPFGLEAGLIYVT